MSRTRQKIGDILLEKLTPRVKITALHIYQVSDNPDNPITKFPEDNLPKDHPKAKRKFHKQRYVLVIQNNKLNQDKNVNSVMVIPLSSGGTDTKITVVIPTKYLDESLPDDAVARVHLTQPILKYFLETKVGEIPDNSDIAVTIRSTYLRILGML